MVRPDLIEMLERRGLLLAADATLPSVATIVAGEPVRGSWWAHPKSHAIFAASSALARHPDAIAIPLILGKVTFVHRRLWPALLAVAQARAPWQTTGLSRQARALLKRVEKHDSLQASGDAVRELERRLLARTEPVHTEAGSHAKRVESWDRWAARVGIEPLRDAADARRQIDAAVAALAVGPTPKLPWSDIRKPTRRIAVP